MTHLEFTVENNPEPVSAERLAEILANPGFGAHTTDHMVLIDWDKESGWHDARVVPYSDFHLNPVTSVFHYGQAIFEGIKAYRQADGSIKTFRPEKNAQRFQDSARRIAMPELPQELFLESLQQLVSVDRRWVPEAGGEASLYLRPFMIATEKTLGVHPSATYTYAVVASPAGAYFSGGINPVKVWLSEEYVRACPGGTGAAKFAGNYAASLAAQEQASEKGCDQVVWLDAIERKYVEEMGGMNIFFVIQEAAGDPVTVVTPKLSGSLLPGVTRNSLLQVARDAGFEVTERLVSTEEWAERAADGTLLEAFACGTAAVITPIGQVTSAKTDFEIHNNTPGEITMQLREKLTGIQKGTEEDTHDWMYTLIAVDQA
ncbi:MAG: branched-chain amino acid aminotransferase [Corynebacterium sp.]|nr:branched-chain amino acid aminotransferase [Corynebacterium sp.]